MSNVKAMALLAFGYLLVFAAFADKGKYALRPWQAVQA